jgi:hypothetical protein
VSSILPLATAISRPAREVHLRALGTPLLTMISSSPPQEERGVKNNKMRVFFASPKKLF